MNIYSVLICLLLSTITSVTYIESLHNSLLTLWDDQGYVTRNEHIRALNWDTVYYFFTHIQMHNWHPLTSLSYALDYQLWELEAWGYHLTNLIFHNANVILFFITAWLLLNLYHKNNSMLAAALAAALFAIHPQHVESVAWISERKDVLFLFFTFLTLIAYLYYVRRQKLFYYFLALLCFICALLSKPMAITLPAVLILMDVFPLQRTSLTVITLYAASYQKILLEKIPFFLLSFAAVIMTLLAQRIGGDAGEQVQLITEDGIKLAGGAIQSFEQLGMVERLLNAANSLLHYMTKLFFPVQLSPYYDMPSEFSIVPVIVVIGITALCVYAWYKKHYFWLIAWLFYVGTLLPVIGIIQVGGQAAADRYAYLPLLPFYLIIGYFAAQYIIRFIQQKKYLYFSMLALTIITILLNLSLLTQNQILVWRNDYSLWQHVYRYDFKNYRAAVNLAVLHERDKRPDMALYFYQSAVQTNPDVLSNYNYLANFYVKQGQIDNALAIYEQMDAKGLMNEKGAVATTYFNMAMLYLKKNQINQAIAAAKKTLLRDPNHQQAQAFLRDYNEEIN